MRWEIPSGCAPSKHGPGQPEVGAGAAAHDDAAAAIGALKAEGFRLFGSHLGVAAVDYRQCDLTGPKAFALGFSEEAAAAIDRAIGSSTGHAEPLIIRNHHHPALKFHQRQPIEPLEWCAPV